MAGSEGGLSQASSETFLVDSVDIVWLGRLWFLSRNIPSPILLSASTISQFPFCLTLSLEEMGACCACSKASVQRPVPQHIWDPLHSSPIFSFTLLSCHLFFHVENESEIHNFEPSLRGQPKWTESQGVYNLLAFWLWHAERDSWLYRSMAVYGVIRLYR